jgi:hypothetical protein
MDGKSATTRLISCCGNLCHLCPRYTATQSGSRDELEKVARLWFRLGYRDSVVSPEEIACQGCKPENWCRYEINTCCKTMNVQNCGLCNKYPCEKNFNSFERTNHFSEQSKHKCSKAEHEILYNSFYRKKEILDQQKKS